MQKLYFSILLLFVFSANIIAQGNSQNFWQKNNGLKKDNTKKAFRKSEPNKFHSYTLNISGLKNALKSVSKRGSSNENSNFILNFPNAVGDFEAFKIVEASIFSDELQEKHPDIRSYAGQGIDDPTALVRFSISKVGLHAMVLRSDSSTLFIDPYSLENSEYLVYAKNELPKLEIMNCQVQDAVNKLNEKGETSNKSFNANDGKLRTFDLALACTIEYSAFHLTEQGVPGGATEAVKKAAVLGAMTTTITRVNGIFERDLGLTMTLVANNEDIIFIDSDSFSNNNASALINESQTEIDAAIGSSNYDIGHTFSTGGGGIAQLNSPCTANKARGVTGTLSPIGDSYDVDYVAHEMGHQYGAHHTFNSGVSNCGGGNRNNGTAVEPGSGSTIMAYAGICPPENVQNNSDSYFHSISIQEMWANITVGSSTCVSGDDTVNDNQPSASAGSDFTIPKSTPFVLTGVGADLDGDAITYCWEQTDTEITAFPLVSTATEGPAFRSFSPTSSDKRYFPELSTVIAGNLSSTWEVLPSVSRTLNFDLTVRDNNVAGGQSARDAMVVTIDDSVGPLTVTTQASEGIIWLNGANKTINWDVNGTSGLSGASNVNILLSTDGGLTYPTTLASNVTNDGSTVIVVPAIPAPFCRVMVQASGNIFYSINSTDFSIDYTVTTVCNTYDSTDIPMTIINNSGTFDTSGLSVPGSLTISDVNINVDITHPRVGQLLIAILSPDGTQVDLYERDCSSEDDMVVTFDDAGTALVCASPTTGTYIPSNSLSVLNGEAGNGTWTLGVNDNMNPDGGTLNDWSVEICSKVGVPLSVKKFEFNQFSVASNPTDGIMNISLITKSTEDIAIKLYDLTGRLVLAESHENFGSNFSKKIDIENLAAGVYLLNVSSGDQVSSRQIIKI